MVRVFLLKVRLHLAFAVLAALSKASPPLPKRTCERFARSAAKRDPRGVTVTQIIDIVASNSFDRDFCLGRQGRKLKLLRAIHEYLFRSRTAIDPRKPEPGFHPGMFDQHQQKGADTGIDPYIEFLRQGRPAGPWLLPVIEGSEAQRSCSVSKVRRTALHIHAYYIDQLSDILCRLETSELSPDLFISIRDEADVDAVRARLQGYDGVVVDIRAYPNLGRDIGPLLTGFGTRLLGEYDFIGHVHTKASLFSDDGNWVVNWSNLLLSNTIGGEKSGPMIDRIIEAMICDPGIGIVYPADPHIPGWGPNKTSAIDVAQRIGLKTLPEAFSFPIGTMFWIKAEAFRPFVDLNLKWQDYPKEPIPNDGTILHALERLFGVVPPANGWDTVLTHTPRITR